MRDEARPAIHSQPGEDRRADPAPLPLRHHRQVLEVVVDRAVADQPAQPDHPIALDRHHRVQRGGQRGRDGRRVVRVGPPHGGGDGDELLDRGQPVLQAVLHGGNLAPEKRRHGVVEAAATRADRRLQDRTEGTAGQHHPVRSAERPGLVALAGAVDTDQGDYHGPRLGRLTGRGGSGDGGGQSATDHPGPLAGAEETRLPAPGRAGPAGQNCRVPVHEITDPDDDRIADYRALTDVELRTRWEPPHGLFIAEGELVLRRALRAGYPARSYLVDAKRVDQLADLDTGETPVYAATPEVLRRATGFHVHRGVLASFHRKPLPRAAEVLDTARRVVILEDVNNHTNLGAIFRAVAALGVDGVLLSPTCADPLYRRSVRVSMGEVFAIPYAKLEPWPDALAQVRAAGFTVLAMTPAPDAVPIQGLDAAQRARAALLMGAEGAGLTRAAMDASDVRVVIPMRRGVDSLNVAAATAVACWELGRDDPL